MRGTFSGSSMPAIWHEWSQQLPFYVSIPRPRLRITRRLGTYLVSPGAKAVLSPRSARPSPSQALGIRDPTRKNRNCASTTEFERQLVRYVKKARAQDGSTGTNLLKLLENRLDNVCFRMGFGPTVPGARQLVNHGHVTVNGRVTDIASYQCKVGDVIAIRERKASKRLAEGNLEFPGLANIPPHLDLDKTKLSAKVTGRCEREWVALEINELLVVEYYPEKSDPTVQFNHRCAARAQGCAFNWIQPSSGLSGATWPGAAQFSVYRPLRASNSSAGLKWGGSSSSDGL